MTGEQPFLNIKHSELAYRISLGVRPGKPKNAEAIGISESLWELVQKCWGGDKDRRPRIQEVVTEVGSAAAKWHTVTPPSATENREDSDEDSDRESDESKHGEFSLFPVVSSVLRPSVESEYSSLIVAETRHLLVRMPTYRDLTIHTLSQPNQLRRKPMKNMLSPSSNT